MRNSLGIALRVFLLSAVALGLGYPLLVTGIAQALFSGQANGSLVRDSGGNVVGSSLLSQAFTSAEYFQPRASAGGHDPLASGGSNLGPTSAELASQLKERAADYDSGRGIPADAVTASASGLDPDISPANAYAQAGRVARSRSVTPSEVRALVASRIAGRDLGFIGEERVNVLELNMALDETFGPPR